MMHAMRRTAPAIALALLLAPASAAAGPWAPDAGHGYVKLWLKYLYGFGYFDGQGQMHDYTAYHELFLSAYAEVGLVDRLALVVHAPIVQTFHLEDPHDGAYDSFLGPGDPTLSLRWQFLQIDRLASSIELGVRAPFARPGPLATVYARGTGNPPVGALQMGTGVWDVPITVAAGYGWDGFYLAGSIAYVVRTSGYDHVLAWSVEGGTTIEARWGLRGRVVGWHSLDVHFDEGAPRHESPSGIGNGTSYVGFALEVDYRIEENLYIGFTGEGGIGGLVRQTGGPVVTLYVAARF
jgi:hypothetical protein